MPDEPRYSLTELADLAGVTPRTVRYYIASGLLPSPGQPGPGAKYGEDVLDRLRLIRRLQRDHLPLAEIRHRLAALTADVIRDLAGAEPEPSAPGSALDYIRDVLGTGRTGSRVAEPDAPYGSAGPRMRASLYRSIGAPMPALAAAPAAPPPTSTDPVAEPLGDAPGPTPIPVERSQWERIALAPDVELHVRRPSSRIQNKRIDRLVTIARELLEED